MAWTRDAALRALGFHIRRFWNADADADLGGVIETILAHAGATFSSSPIEDRS
jgi:very-short-patch-repair endonuclease